MRPAEIRFNHCVHEIQIALRQSRNTPYHIVYSRIYDALCYRQFPGLVAHHSRLAFREVAKLLAQYDEGWDKAILEANCRGAAWCVYPKLDGDPDLDATTESLWRKT